MVIYLVYKFVYIKYCKNKDTPTEIPNPADPNHTETRLLDPNNETTNSNNKDVNAILLRIKSNDLGDKVEEYNYSRKNSFAKLENLNQP